jgi:hypothetical protein
MTLNITNARAKINKEFLTISKNSGTKLKLSTKKKDT